MSAPAKYLFDNPLDAPAAPPAIAFSDVEDMKEEHAAELIRVREEALAQGREEGRIEAKDSLEHELFKKLDQIVQDKEASQQEIDAELHATRASSVLLAMTIAKKLAGSLLARYPVDHIEQFFRDSLSLLPDDASLRLHVAPHLAAPLQPRLEALLDRNGQENALQTVEDDTIEGVKCRLVWVNGGIEQDTDHIFIAIEKMIETCLYSHAEPSQAVTAKEPQAELDQAELEPATDIARPTI